VNSKIFTGTIEHRRYSPVDHRLSYPLYMYAFDLDELGRLNQRYPLFGYNRLAVTAIHDKDVLEPDALPVKEKIFRLLARHQVRLPVSRIIMITSARYFNYVFNPVNFYYCLDANSRLSAVVAEVNNTYGERHPYVLIPDALDPGKWAAKFQTPKVFHVSPFNRVEGVYHFYFSEPGDHIEIRIELIQDNKKILAAAFKAKGQAMTPVNHLKTIFKYPVAPHLSIPRIYTHAFKLFFRKHLPFNYKPVPENPMTLKRQAPGMVEAFCRVLVFKELKKINQGCLKVAMPNGAVSYFGNARKQPCAVIDIQAYPFFPRLVFNGEIGFGESFMHGEWKTPDIVALLTLLIKNRDALSDGNLVLSFLTRIKEKMAHDRRWNTIRNTSENIRAHYDLSNAFYERFLDDKMLYSCGIFDHPRDALEKAQERKMERILAQARIRDTHHVLEIGCGWGGFAVFAAKKTGCRVTGITVSQAQYDRAIQRVKAEGLDDRITIELKDYRHVTGTFDRIVSIEMIEAVGPQFFASYFKQGYRLLKPSGRMVFQAIIISDDRYEAYCRERDWIQKHIFPGGHLPCLKILESTIADHTSFKVLDIHHMGLHYATTLSHWRDRFLANWEAISGMGFDETFRRKWVYYFSICEAGFIMGGIDNVQVTMIRSL